MCLNENDKARLQSKLENQNRLEPEDWLTLRTAMDNCDFVAEDPWFDGQWIITVTCHKCGASFSGCGGEDDEIEAFLNTDPD
tara:strand:+ start:135 stop:380 length:246 start_codon:yes stop_codon:yes gene_type:complete